MKTPFTVFDPALLIGREFVPGNGGIELCFAAGTEKIALTVLAALTLKGLDGTLFD